jgi:homoserine O-acetyltransferase
VTIRDMVAAQYALVCALGVKSLASISGASMGGQQALQWIVDHPDFVRSAIPIACSARLSAMGLAISDLCRRAILEDPDWNNGNYYGRSTPKGGLAVARMMAHLTYISAAFLDVEFGRRPWINDNYVYKYELGSEFAVQHYLQDEGERFITRFDANSFLYLSQAIEYFDLTRGKRSLAAAFERVRSSVLLISFRTDWLFPVAHLRELETALREARVDVNHITVETSFGHDAFLTDWRKISPLVSEFLSTINTVALP